MSPNTSNWSIKDSAQHYHLAGWANGYFGLSDEGNVTAKTADTAVPLLDIVHGMAERDLHMPVLLRIENILDAQIQSLNM